MSKSVDTVINEQLEELYQKKAEIERKIICLEKIKDIEPLIKLKPKIPIRCNSRKEISPGISVQCSRIKGTHDDQPHEYCYDGKRFH